MQQKIKLKKSFYLPEIILKSGFMVNFSLLFSLFYFSGENQSLPSMLSALRETVLALFILLTVFYGALIYLRRKQPGTKK